MLNRLGPYLAYATATIARAETTIDTWADVEPMELAAEALLSIPPADAINGYANLGDDVSRVVPVLAAVSKQLGFEIASTRTRIKRSSTFIDRGALDQPRLAFAVTVSAKWRGSRSGLWRRGSARRGP